MKTSRFFLTAALALGVMPALFAQNSYSGGSGTEADPYKIATRSDLVALSTAINSGTADRHYYQQTADIDLASEAWTPIGTAEHPFIGFYDGNGYSISHLSINSTEANQGLFGYLGYFNAGVPSQSSTGQIWNVMLQSGSVTGSGSVGAICGYSSYGGIIGCANYGCTVSASAGAEGSDFGGICGHSEWNGYSMLLCNYNGASVTGQGNVGGICGSSDGRAQYNLNTGAVSSADAANVGAILGLSGNQKDAQHCSLYDTNAFAASLSPLAASGSESEAFLTNKSFTTEQLASGEAAYFLNSPELYANIWFQKIGTDQLPKLMGTYKHSEKEDVTQVVKKDEDTYYNLSATITFDQTGTISIYRNEGRKLTVTTENVSEDIVWTSSAPTICHVDQQGNITGVAGGTATITASANGASASIKVSVSSSYQDGQFSHYYLNGVWYTLNSTAKTASVTYKGGLYNSYSNEYTGNVVIPSSIWVNGVEYAVTTIGSDAFYDCSGLTSLIIPESVTSIGSSAFYRCSSLTSLIIPNSVKGIGSSAFSGCSSLVNFEIEDVRGLCRWGNTTYGSPLKCNTEDKHLFINGEEVTDIIIPDGVTRIGSNAFYGCTDITSVTIPNSIETIENTAFEGCTSLNTFKYPNFGVFIDQCNTSAGNPAKLVPAKEIHLVVDEKEITELSAENLQGYDNLPDYAFYNCAYITDIVIPAYITSIGSNVFAGCTSVREIPVLPTDPPTLSDANSFPGYVTVIVNSDRFEAYAACDGWKDLAASHQLVPRTENNERTITVEADPLMSAVHKAIGDQFTDVYKLKVIGTINGYDFMFLNTKLCSLKELDLSEASVVYNAYEYKPGYHSIDNEITDYAFAGMKTLTSIKLPKAITKIGNYALAEDVNLFKIEIQEGMTSIGSYAFNNCSNLVNLEIAGEVTSIGSYAFNNCSNLVNLEFPGEVTSIGSYAFYKCSNLVNLKIPGEVKSIGSYAFANTLLKKLEIRGNNCNLQSFAFASRITDLTLSGSFSLFMESCLPSSLEQIDLSGITQINKIDYKGVALSKITELYFPDLVNDVTLTPTSIYCPNLKTLRLPGGLKSIGRTVNTSHCPDYLYDKNYNNWIVCNKLETLIIPASVESIDRFAFHSTVNPNTEDYSAGLPALTTVRFEAGSKLKIIDDYTFRSSSSIPTIGSTTWILTKSTNFDNLQNIEFEEGALLESIGLYAFCGCKQLSGFNFENLTNLVSIKPRAFEYCNISNIDFGANSVLKTIEDYALNTSTLTTLKLPSSLEYLGSVSSSYLKSVTFYPDPNVTTINGIHSAALTEFTIPSKVTTIGSFSGCSALKTLVVSPGVTKLSNSMLSGCSSLETVSMPSSIQSIGASAFKNCVKLTEFKIPSGCTSIGQDAFSGCTALKDIYSYTLEPTKITETTFPNMGSSTLHVPRQAYYIYFYATTWSEFLNISTFLEPYDYFYVNGDVTLDKKSGTIEGEPEAELNAGGGLILRDEIGQKLGDVHIKNDGTLSASLLYDATTEIVEGSRLFQEINVKPYQWYFFCFPFDALRSDVQSPGSYVFRYYDGAERAASGTGNSWKLLPDDDPELHAGMGYIYQTNTAGTLTVPVNSPDFTNVTRAQDLKIYNAANTANASWNFTGNVTPSYYEIGDMQYTAPITIWDGKTYVAYRPEDDVYLLSPFQAFFVQRPVNAESLTFSDENRMTYLQGQEASQAKQARRRAAAKRLDRLVFDMVFSLDTLSDRTRVVYNDMATIMYDMDHDASKFFSMDQTMPQFYSLDGREECYAINERPTADGRVRLGYYAPRAGTYTIRAERLDAFCKLHDNVTGRDIDLDLDDYTFQSEAGTFENRFEFRCSADVNGLARIQQETGVSLQGGEGQLIVKGASADQSVHIYNVQGEEVAVAQGNGAIDLPQGMYVAAVGKVSTKVMVM